ncbi:phosphate/phosphite/phosphonate ABC transporter substrate-binding protein [Larkinella soli]|uniref:phosphate/phosphite/phosphonate ABC transporter substrate-binding protein n=1 Tax=Larkinella soli TaxID=1770527 RepID=UPI000FFC8AC2|nr:phosphate/phosphite/phosphonate ABC transporter substrate-binding protein [Larkinella soli]
MIRIVFRFLLVCLFTVSFAASFAQPRPLTLATYTYADNNRLGNIGPLAEVLSRKLGIPVRTRSYENVKQFIAGLEAGEVDIALISTFGYLLLINRGNSPYTPAAALEVPEGVRDNYKSAIVVHASLPIRQLSDLKAHAADYRMTFVSETSTSGNLIPRAFLSANGLTEPERQFLQVTYSKTHAEGLTALLDRRTDLAAFGSEEYHKALRHDPGLTHQVRLLWESEEIPLGPVLLKNSLDSAQRQKITHALLALHRKHSDALESLRAGWSEARQAEKFRPVDRAFYESYRQRIGASQGLIEQFSGLIR